MSTFGLAEGFASWQWVNYLISKVPTGKKPLLINMDETAVCLFQGTGRGTIIAGKKRKRGRGEPVQLVNRATRRTYLTHVAFICDQPLYQKYMQQIVIGNEHTLLVHWPCSWPKGTGQVVCSGGDVALVSGAKRSDSSSSNSSCRRTHKLFGFVCRVQSSLGCSDYKAPAAMKFLTMTGRKRRWPEKPESELEELVEDVFMQCDTNELAGLADKDSSTDPTAFAAAVPYIEEWNMAAFVEDQNVRFGLAPSTESLLDRWGRRRAMYPEAFRPLDPGFVAEAKARKWAHRFRARWGAWHGGIRVRDDLPLEETRTKAGPEK